MVYTGGGGIDDPVIRATVTGASTYGQAQYYYADGLGSVVGLSNNTDSTTPTQRFDAWGNKLAGTIAQNAQYGYTGREPDETGLIYYRARYYDPSLGRFVQRDPAGLSAGNNLYAYVNNNPINAIDPMGLVYIFVGGAGDVTFSGGLVKRYSESFQGISGQAITYFTWDQGSDIQQFINSQPAGEPINLIGHSYGGDTAATVAANSSRPINMLVTIDPVSWFRPDYAAVSNNTNMWVDVNAQGGSSFDWSNILAGLGGAWDESLQGIATSYIVDPNSVHANFDGLMNATAPGARSPLDLLTDPSIAGIAGPLQSNNPITNQLQSVYAK